VKERAKRMLKQFGLYCRAELLQVKAKDANQDVVLMCREDAERE